VKVMLLTGLQIRAARVLLKWTIKDLAAASGVSAPTIQRLEQDEGVAAGRMQTIAEIINAFSKSGIEFIGTPENGAGVRFKPK
ncbi:MAG: helix-turn-helix domain-containing protein, partial [Hyphomicrobiales bacterium]